MQGKIPLQEITEAREKPQPVQEIGKGKAGPGRGNKTDSVSTRFNKKRDSNYLLRRLSRDHPELLDKLETGEIKSVRQAAIAAGIVKPPSDLTLAKRAYEKLTDQDRQRFCEWLARC